ncbi:DUF2399 domain-containing protein [Streptomyces sp. NPDC085479]|uniref:DUF2399 domain-containing protein n=1 Tax=Streptomyces sp. NPDC085479 TaxID=3365726 RepID=UPI0037CCD9A3
MLANHGAELRYHDDFDGEGIRIAAYVMAKTPACPWRMSAAGYRTALTHHPNGPDAGRVTPAPWDDDLTRALADNGTAVIEELVADTS